MKILITGASGFIGRHLTSVLKQKYEVVSLGFRATSDTQMISVDLRDRNQTARIIECARPNVVIHLAGNKNLVQCESKAQEIDDLNFGATKTLVDLAAPQRYRFLFISSDYVFDGASGNFKETDIPSPRTEYGRQKLKSEHYAQKQLRDAAIVRTSAVYGPGATFFSWILESLKKGTVVRAFEDAVFTPTSIEDVSWVFQKIIERELTGIFHVAGPEAMSRFEMARKLARHFGYDAGLVHATRASDEPGVLVAANTSLNADATSAILQKKFQTLEEGLRILFPQIKR